MNDSRRKQRSNSHDGSNDYTDRGTTAVSYTHLDVYKRQIMGAHICFDRHIHIANKTWSKGVLRHLGYEDIDEQTLMR